VFACRQETLEYRNDKPKRLPLVSIGGCCYSKIIRAIDYYKRNRPGSQIEGHSKTRRPLEKEIRSNLLQRMLMQLMENF
jgi:hypothetical protein